MFDDLVCLHRHPVVERFTTRITSKFDKLILFQIHMCRNLSTFLIKIHKQTPQSLQILLVSFGDNVVAGLLIARGTLIREIVFLRVISKQSCYLSSYLKDFKGLKQHLSCLSCFLSLTILPRLSVVVVVAGVVGDGSFWIPGIVMANFSLKGCIISIPRVLYIF